MKFLPPVLRRVCLTTVMLLAGGAAQASSTLYFPRISAAGVHGLAFFNPGIGSEPAGAGAEISLALYDQNGVLVQGAGITNPALLLVPSGQNRAVTVEEVFGLIAPSVTGWIEATSPVDNLTGFFLFLSSDQSKLDGADQPSLGRRIVFNDVRGSNEFRTEINVFNSAESATRLTLTLLTPQGVFFRTVGEPAAEGFDPTFPARGLLRIDDVAEFFGLNSIPSNSYLEVQSETQIGGFQFLWTSDGDLLGLNARKRSEWLKTLSFPQLAVGGPWKMEVNVVNYSLQQVRLLFRARRPDGQPYAPPDVIQNPAVRLLDADSALVEDVGQLFGFTGEGPFEGSLRVESYLASPTLPGNAAAGEEPFAAINGSVRYGVISSGSEASVPAPLDARHRVIFAHLATVQGFFTGFAAFNSSSAASDLRVMAFREDGSELGLFDTILQPGERIARLVTEILPATDGQNGGYLWAESSQPLYYSALFGSSNATVLANVPPQPVPESFLPDTGKPGFRVEPGIASVALGAASGFVAEGGSGDVDWSVQGIPGGGSAIGEIDASGNYLAPDVFPEPEGPLTVVARQDELIAAATVDLLEKSAFTEQPVPGVLTRIAYDAGLDRLFGVVASGGGAVAGEETVSSLIEIEPTSQTLILDLPGEEVSDVLPFETGGKAFLLLSSRTTNRVLRLDPGTALVEEVVNGLEVPLAMAWEPLGGSLLVADASSIQSVSRPRLDSDLVSGVPGNGRATVTLTGTESLRGLATDSCTGRILWSDGEGRIRAFDPFTRSSDVLVEGLESPLTLLTVYRQNGDCRAALRLLTVQGGSGDLSLIDPSAGSVVALAEAGNPADFTFVGNGLESSDLLLLVDRSVAPAGTGPSSQILSVRSPRQHQAFGPGVVGLGIPGSAADFLGDTFGGGEVQVDALELSAFYDDEFLYIGATFADAIQPCDEQCLQGVAGSSLAGALDFDLDRDPATGVAGLAELNSFSDSGLGIEAFAYLSAYDEQAGGVPVFVLVDETFEEAGRVPVVFGTHDISLAIPLSMLADDGKMRLAGVFGPADGASDVVPDAGFVEAVELEESPFQAGVGESIASSKKTLPCAWQAGLWIGPQCQGPTASSR